MKLHITLCLLGLLVCGLSLVTARPHEKRHRHKSSSDSETDDTNLEKHKHHKKNHNKKEHLNSKIKEEKKKEEFLDDYINSYEKYDHYDIQNANSKDISASRDTSSLDSNSNGERDSASTNEKSENLATDSKDVDITDESSNDWFNYQQNKPDFWDFLDTDNLDYKDYHEKMDTEKNYYESDDEISDGHKESIVDTNSKSSDGKYEEETDENEDYEESIDSDENTEIKESNDFDEDQEDYNDEDDEYDDEEDDEYDDEEDDEYDDEYDDEEDDEYNEEDSDEDKIDSDFQQSNASYNNLENNETGDKHVRFGNSGFDHILKDGDLPYNNKKLESKKDHKGDDFNSHQFDDLKEDYLKLGNLPEVPRTLLELRTSPNPPTPIPSKEAATVTPAGKMIEAEESSHRVEDVPPSPYHHYIKSRPHENCKYDEDCPPGRKCTEDMCVCADVFLCFGHDNPICGSDGALYPSHCELHRTACVKGVHIKIDHSRKCYSDKDIAKVQFPDKPPNGDDYFPKQFDEKTEDYIEPWEKSDQKKDDDIIKSSKPYVYEPQLDEPQSCTKDEYIKFKAALLWFHCAKIDEPDCKKDTVEAKGFLATLMFSYYDRNKDGQIAKEELWEIQLNDKLQSLSKTCTLLDMLNYDDVDRIDTSQISSEEFLHAFENVPAIALAEEMRLVETMATVGNGLQISCDIKGANDIVWRRYGINLLELDIPGITVFEDGSLFFDTIGVQHMGNFTCHAQIHPSVKQIHLISVQMPPVVQVSPSLQIHQSHSDIMIKCHAEGLPQPRIQWEVNELALPNDPNHFIRTHENGSLVIHSADYQRDTGAYKCVAHNSAGTAEDIATIFIKKPNDSHILAFEKASMKESLIVFHREGYSVYNPAECMTQRMVKGNFGNFQYIPDDLDEPLFMCADSEECVWGDVANVKDKFIYVSQPYLNRLLIVDVVHTMNPIQVILTDKFPVEVNYIEQLDEIWVVCLNSLRSYGTKTVVVIREASEDIQHHAVHMQPVGNRFDQIERLFLPPTNDLGHKFQYGYLVHNQQRGMFKVDLQGMMYTKALDFGQFDCIPQAVAFVPLGGHIIVKCIKKTETGELTLQLTLDYISDKVVSNMSLFATPYVSPDSRRLVYVDEVSGKIYVNNVLDSGEIRSVFDATVGTPISAVTFFPSMITKGYDLFLSGYSSSEIYSVSLTNGKVTTIKDVDEAYPELPSPWSKTNRPLVSGNMFTEYLASPSQSSVVIVNGKLHRVQCKFLGLEFGDVLIFANPVIQ